MAEAPLPALPSQRREGVQKQAPVLGELPRYDDGTAIAEMGHAASVPEIVRRNPMIPPRDAAAQAQRGFRHDLDPLELDRCRSAHLHTSPSSMASSLRITSLPRL